MFQVKYHMDMKRYRSWTCPPVHKTRGFWFWLALLIVCLPAMIWLRVTDGNMRLQSLTAMGVLIAVYRGFLFRPMYANKQFRVMCIDYKKESHEGWNSRVDIGEDGIDSFMDDRQLNHVNWDEVDFVVSTTNYVDFSVEQDFIRLPKDSFTVGTAEEFVAWLDEKHPDLRRKQEVKAFDN